MIAGLPDKERPIDLRSIDSFIARLHWHCHFIQKLECEPEIERRAVHPMFEAVRCETAPDDPRLLAWIEGRTGFPFVDACMRSLAASGWINFRMRAMLMAFASYHLALDWRVSGARLASYSRITSPESIGHRFKCSLDRPASTHRASTIL